MTTPEPPRVEVDPAEIRSRGEWVPMRVPLWVALDDVTRAVVAFGDALRGVFNVAAEAFEALARDPKVREIIAMLEQNGREYAKQRRKQLRGQRRAAWLDSRTPGRSGQARGRVAAWHARHRRLRGRRPGRHVIRVRATVR